MGENQSVVPPEKRHGVEKLFSEFLRAYPPSDEGKRHIKLYVRSREDARKNYAKGLAMVQAGEDTTDFVLRHLLPHYDNAPNKKRDAWIHVAPVLRKDVKSFFENGGWAKAEDWPRISRMILDFVRRCNDHPDELPTACIKFAKEVPAKGFQSAILSPILNALRPDHFAVVNSKPLHVVKVLTGKQYRTAIEVYPKSNAKIMEILSALAGTLTAGEVREIEPCDAFDMFCHWLVAVRKRSFEKDLQDDGYVEPRLPTPNPKASRYWAIALGEGGRLWNECQEQGIAAIGWDYLGDFRQYPDQDAITKVISEHDGGDIRPTNKSLCCWQFANDMAIGDTVIAKIGRRRLLGIGKIESDYQHIPSRREYHNVRKVKWLAADTFDLPDDSILPTKTLTDVTEYSKLIDFVHDNYDMDTPVPTQQQTYSVEEAMTGLFMPREQLETILAALRFRKNVVLQGPPGVGKTYIAKRIAWTLLGAKDDSRVQTIQFHQSYAYEDFIQGWRPADDGRFRLKNGVFFEFCNKARMDLARPYVFIIDEINRGNLSKILGELMMLIEADKRGADYAIPLTYSEPGELFSVPGNVYILGLMNTADRSLAMVDYALRRRFRFVELCPQFSQPGFAEHLREHEASDKLIRKIIDRMASLNEKIASDHRNLGRGFTIGHSFFCIPSPDTVADEKWYQSVIECEVAPLIDEYWFDRRDTAKKWIDGLLAP